MISNMRIQYISLGILYGVISALSFAIMSVCVKKIGHALPTAMLIFFRFGISFILLLPWIILKEPKFSLKIAEPVRYTVRIFTALSALFCVFYAIKYMPLVDVLLLNNTAPLFVPLIALLMTGAKTPPKACFGIIVGFIGIAFILHPGKELFSGGAGMWIALASGILAAIAIVQMRLISKTSTTVQMLFWYFFVSTIVSGIVAIFSWQSPETMTLWLLLLAVGIFGTLYQVFATLSYVNAPVRLVSPLIFLTVVFGGVFDWLIWHNVPSALTIIGAVIVLMGVIITVYFGHKKIVKKL